MKRFFVFFVSALLLLSSFCVRAADQEYHFYIKRQKDHAPARTDPRFEDVFDEYSFHRDVLAAERGEKKLYLTFDAGYENGNVEKILDILKRENVPGAFFVLSHFVRSNQNLLSRMKAEGHLICNHTASHRNMARMDSASFRRELCALETAYTEETGECLSKFYRPPEGTFSLENLKTAKEMGYKTVFWSMAYPDWNDDVAPPREKVLALLKESTHPGAILLLHPTSKINVDILEEMIGYWKSEGYTLCSLSAIGS